MRVKDLGVLRLVILRLACQFLLGLFGARQELRVSQVVIGTFLGGWRGGEHELAWAIVR